MLHFSHGATAKSWERLTIYTPKKRPGFVAWTTAFPYADGRVGLSFKETVASPDPHYRPPKLEMGEAVGAPVSYCSVECGSETERSYRVYCVSGDGGKSFTETGRCPLDEGSFCNVGMPDGSILGYDVPRLNEEGTGWCACIKIRKSTDGGTTWTPCGELLTGTAPYLWRVRILKDGTILLLLSLYGTPWGGTQERTTRNTMLPGESYIRKIQTCFMASRDGLHFTGPHYVLPGIGAHEYDVAECPDGRLLFIAGDVQATPVGRQFVTRDGERYINGTLYGVYRGAPEDPKKNPQGGFVPESLVMLPDGMLVGSRRNKPYAASVDFGENWYEIDGLPTSLYQPFLMALSDGTVLNFGHRGGDSALGQEDMVIGVDRFQVKNGLPAACSLRLSRSFSPDGTRYINAFAARLTTGKTPVAGETVLFRASPVWNDDGSVNTDPQELSKIQLSAVTDENGMASIALPMFDGVPDIHCYYNIDVIYRPTGKGYAPCDGPMMCVAAMTPKRRCRYPYDAYFAEGKLFVSPRVTDEVPDAIDKLNNIAGSNEIPADALPEKLVQLLEKANVLTKKDGALHWYRSTHAEQPLVEALPMGSGDWYE